MTAWGDQQLPDEVSLRVFHCLGARELAEASLVSRLWLHLIRDEAVWRGVAVHRWGAGAEQLGVTEWRSYCRDRAAFERVRETAVSRGDPGTAFIFAPVSVGFSASRLFDEGHVNNAIVALDTETRRHPVSADAWALMGRAYAENGQDSEAIACFKIANALDPHNQKVLVDLGILQVNESCGARACLYFAKWLRLSPYSSLLTQDLEKEIIKQASEQKPTTGSSLLNWQERWGESDARTDVRVLLTEVLKSAHGANDQDFNVCVMLGALFTACNLYTLSLTYLKLALAINPSDYALWNKFGATQANNQSHGLAVPSYAKALALRPNYVRCMGNMGVAQMVLGRRRLALHYWARALMLNPKANHIWDYIRMADDEVSDVTDYEQALPRYIIEGDVPVEFDEADT